MATPEDLVPILLPPSAWVELRDDFEEEATSLRCGGLEVATELCTLGHTGQQSCTYSVMW